MKRGSAKSTDAFETREERRARLGRMAEAAAGSLARTGRVLRCYDRPDVLGSMVARGLATAAQLEAAGAVLGARFRAALAEAARDAVEAGERADG